MTLTLLGVLPIASDTLYKKMFQTLWQDKAGPLSEKEDYNINRFVRPATFIIIGVILMGIATCRLFFS